MSDHTPLVCRVPAEYSASVTAVRMPEGLDADAVRKVALDRFDMSLGTGLGKTKGKVFRIGHLADFNDLTLLGTLAVELEGLAEKVRVGWDAGLDVITAWLPDGTVMTFGSSTRVTVAG